MGMLIFVMAGTALLLAMMVWGGRRLTDEQRRVSTSAPPRDLGTISNIGPKADEHPISAEAQPRDA